MKKITKYMISIVVLLSGILMLIYGFSYAKYASNAIWNYYLSSKGFYMTSSYLGTSSVKNVNNLWDGSSVHFDLKNSLNESVVTDYDIEYKVICTIKSDDTTAKCNMNNSDSNTYIGTLSGYESCKNYTDDLVDTTAYDKSTCDNNGYTWQKSEGIKDLYFDIVSSNTDVTDYTVNISVDSISPYHKTLLGEFKLHKVDGNDGKIISDYINNTSNDKLNISNSYSVNKCVKVSWNADNLRIKANKDEFKSYNADSNGYINEFVIEIPSKKVLSYSFYKTDKEKTYKIEDLNIEELLSCE